MEDCSKTLDEMNLPKTIYKYRTWTDNFHKQIITEQVVFMAQPSTFEDKKDCKSLKRYDLLTDDDIRNKYLQDSNRNNPKFSFQQHTEYAEEKFKYSRMRDKENIKKLQLIDLEKFDKRIGVLSLTANPQNEAMWYKYSENHKGFCVGFDTKKLFDKLGGGGLVSYHSTLPDILPFDSRKVEACKQIYCKEDRWAYEQEYRTQKFYPLEATTADRRIIVPKDSYKEIIFGAKIPVLHLKEIMQLCKQEGLNVSFFRETLSGKEIKIDKI